jgi:hypothetical protein
MKNLTYQIYNHENEELEEQQEDTGVAVAAVIAIVGNKTSIHYEIKTAFYMDNKFLSYVIHY